MAFRQQRTSQRRRSAINPGGVQLPTMPWQVVWQNPTEVEIEPISPDWGVNPQLGASLNGIPQIEETGLMQMPSAAVLTAGGGVRLTYPGAFTRPTSFRVGASDPAWRGPFAQFLSAQIWNEALPAENAVFQDAILAGTTVTIHLVNPIAKLALTDTWAITNVSTGLRPDRITWDGTNIVTEWGIAPTIGDTIDIQGGPSWWFNSTGGSADAATLFVA